MTQPLTIEEAYAELRAAGWADEPAYEMALLYIAALDA